MTIAERGFVRERASPPNYRSGDVVLGDDWVAPDAGVSEELRSKRARRNFFSLKGSPLTRKIVMFNLIALIILAAGILYLSDTRDSLVLQRANALVGETELIANVFEVQLGDRGLDASDSGTVAATLANLNLRNGVEVFVFDRSGRLIGQTTGTGQSAALTALTVEPKGHTVITDALSRVWQSTAGLLTRQGSSGAATLAGPHAASRLADERANEAVVDVELILAVDVSYSMDIEELTIQREGYAQAIVSKEFLQALKTGPNGRIAITYFEWAASTDQKIIIPWRVIDGPESAGAVAVEIMKTPVRRASRTSISGAINFAMPLFAQNRYRGLRRVIDISGDGPNNNGMPVTLARDAALEKGIVINGLPVMVKEPSYTTMDIENLDAYYEDCVIGGPGSFVVPIQDRDRFREAIRTKLVMEVAGRTPPRRVVPAAGREPRVSCTIGEKLWQDRWGQ